MKYSALLCVLYLFFITDLPAQDSLKYELDEVYISAGRMPVSIDNSARIVTIIKPAELVSVPVNSLQDVLQYMAGLDLKQRGTDGVQADLSIRGSTFEQSLIMIDGIKIIDPQTGHHNLTLPLSLHDIERIEIVKGQASKTFGPNAFGGVVNIITRKYDDDRISLEIGGGENGYNSSTISGNYSMSGVTHRFSFNQSGSDGYRHNTEFGSTTVNYMSNYNFTSGNIGLLFGFNEKDFGANSFYSISFPDQAEHTITKLLSLTANLGMDNFYINPKLYWRRNDDEFVLNKFDPEFYKNLHETNVYGAELQSTLKTDYGLTSLGIELARDVIESTNLGEHRRNKMGIFFEHAAQVTNRLNINLGGFLYKYSNHDWQLWPGLDASYSINESIKTFLSLGKAFRIPTYTELYYSDPVTLGNSNLKQEEAVSYELGITHEADFVSSKLAVFRREGENIIDWVRISDDLPWSVRNIAEVSTNGLEAEIRLFPRQIPVSEISLNYTFLDSDKKTDGFSSRYVLNHLRHQFVAGITHELLFDIFVNWFIRYEDRLNFEDSFLTDLKLSKSIADFRVSLSATNLFNNAYYDFAGVALPGRWIKGSIKYQMKI